MTASIRQYSLVQCERVEHSKCLILSFKAMQGIEYDNHMGNYSFVICVCVCSGSSDWSLLRDQNPSRDPVAVRPAVAVLSHRHGGGQRRVLCAIQPDPQRSQRL